jgi:hypothetical protein
VIEKPPEQIETDDDDKNNSKEKKLAEKVSEILG